MEAPQLNLTTAEVIDALPERGSQYRWVRPSPEMSEEPAELLGLILYRVGFRAVDIGAFSAKYPDAKWSEPLIAPSPDTGKGK